MNPVIAPAGIHDLEELAALHRRCFGGYMNTKLGNAYLKKNIAWYITQPDAALLKLTVNERITGYAAAIAAGSTARMNRSLLTTAMLAFASRPWLLLQKRFAAAALQKLNGMFTPATPAEHEPMTGKGMHLLSICVDEQRQGHGYGKLLLREMEKQAAEKGFDYLRLFGYKHNAAALKFYTDAGWNPLRESESGLYFYKSIHPAD